MAASQAKAEMADSGHAGTPTAPRTTADRTTIVPMAAAATFARHATAAGMTGSARAAAGKTASVTLATGSTTAAAAISMDAAVRTAAKGRVGTPTVPIRPTTPPNPTKAPPTPSGSSKLLTAADHLAPQGPG